MKLFFELFLKGIDEKKCGPILARGVDEKSKQVILQIHNSLRSLVAFGGEIRGQPGPQPPAANMQLMVAPLIILHVINFEML